VSVTSDYRHRQLHRIGDTTEWRCHYCKAKLYCAQCYPFPVPRAKPITRDHIIPKSKGGKGGANLTGSCFGCNQDKGDLMPDESKPVKKVKEGCNLGNPRRRRSLVKQYPTEVLANLMVKVVYMRWGRELEAFQCPHCNQWHLTAKPKSEVLS
jgi:hypothetical protein